MLSVIVKVVYLIVWIEHVSTKCALVFRCDFCKNLAPVWQELALKLSNERAITIGKVDCSISDVMCEERGVSILGLVNISITFKTHAD